MDRQSDTAYVQRQRDAVYGLTSASNAPYARLGVPSGTGVAEWSSEVDRAISRSAAEQADIEQRLADLAPPPLGSAPGILLADNSGNSPFTPGSSMDGLRQGWSREGWSVLQGPKPFAYGFAQGSRDLWGAITGSDAAAKSQAAFKQGNYGVGVVEAAKSVLEAGASVLTLGVGSSANGLRVGGMTASDLAAVRSTYLGDVYSDRFVGPVQWKYFYRGDATARTDFLSSMAQERGVPATTEFLNSRATEPLSNIYAQHGIGSQGLPTIGVSDNRLVAEYFARGPSQTQNGFVTTFRMEARDAERLAIPNWDNPMSFMESNPYIGLPEREFLFHIQIDPRYVVKQVPVGPR